MFNIKLAASFENGGIPYVKELSTHVGSYIRLKMCFEFL